MPSRQFAIGARAALSDDFSLTFARARILARYANEHAHFITPAPEDRDSLRRR
jgi:hypothetical protein